MKLRAFLRLSLKTIFKTLPVFAFFLAGFPLLMSLLMGFVQQDMFTAVVHEPLFALNIIDEDNSLQSHSLSEYLNSEELAEIFTLVDDTEEYGYTLRIPAGYGAGLLGQDEATVKVEVKEKSKVSSALILVGIVDSFNKEMSQILHVNRAIKAMDREDWQLQALIDEFNSLLNAFDGQNLFETVHHNVKNNLDSYEYYSVSFLAFVFFILLQSVIQSKEQTEAIGLTGRILSTPMTRVDYFNYNLVTCILQVFLVSALYVGIYRLLGLSFQGPFFLLVLIVLVQALFIGVLGVLMVNVFTQKYGTILLQLFLMFQIVFGGMVGPLDKWSNSAVFKFAGKIKPILLLSNIYKDFILLKSSTPLIANLFMLLGLFIVLYLANIIIVKLRWGENR